MAKLFLVGIALGGLVALASPANAANFSFTGTFTADDNVKLFNFDVGATSNVTLRTWSYAGGTNAAGQVIPRGGFDPILTLFNGTGGLITENDDGNGVATDPVTGKAADSLISITLAPGLYTLGLTEYDNFISGFTLASGFTRQGQGDFTTAFGCPDNQPAFNDISGVPGCGRTGNWAVDILNVTPAAATPEPASLAVLGFALAGLAFAARRRGG